MENRQRGDEKRIQKQARPGKQIEYIKGKTKQEELIT